MKMSQFDNTQFLRAYRSGNNIMLMGAPGIGKSETMEQRTKANNLGYVELILSQVEAIDIRGIMVPHRRQDGGQPETVSTRTPLASLVEAEQARGVKGGIIFFDEYYQAPHDVRKAVTQFLTSKRIGNWHLPGGWVIWGASNPPEWRAGTVAAMGHENSRWVSITLTPDPDAWAAWAHTAGVHHLYLAFAHRFPHVVFSTEPPKDRNEPHCNPRSFYYANKLHALGVADNNLPTDPVTREWVAGTIGHGAANELFAFLKVQDVIPSPEEMLENPTGCKIPPAERIDARYACMMQAVSYASPDTNEALFEFVKRLDKELAVASIKHFCQKDPMAVNAPNIARFIAENPDSMMALASHG